MLNPLAKLLEQLTPDLTALAAARHGAPDAILGRHVHGTRTLVVLLLPGALRARLNRRRDLTRWRDSPLFAWCGRSDGLPPRYRISWEDADGGLHETHDPYSFPLLTPATALARFAQGRGTDSWQFLGAHCEHHDGIAGVRFACFAPRAAAVTLACGGRRWPMRRLAAGGVWELFLPGETAGARYRFEIVAADGTLHRKADPFGRGFGQRPDSRAIVAGASRHRWRDADWLAARRRTGAAAAPLSIYELHLGSWRRPARRLPNYRELAAPLAAHVTSLGFTHVELLPLGEHPHEDSWGYQATGYFAPTSRYGSADDLRACIDELHGHGLGVILDWVPGHFAADRNALACFDGQPLYEYADPRIGEHRAWGARVFDFTRPEVRSLLLASARYWLEEFHFDGLRVDAVAAMLYLDYERGAGEWLANARGGREHYAASSWLGELNAMIAREFPGVLSIAEDSSAWPGVTRPIAAGGLGFGLKWNLGWMHDTLEYFAVDPLYRRHHHPRLSNLPGRAYAEHYLLPLSHDEVVHGKRSLLGRMPGDDWQRFANLRLLLAWQWLFPGRKLLFMGGEFGARSEWDHRRELEWELMALAPHAGIAALVAELNASYRGQPALAGGDLDPQGFAWLDADDWLRSIVAFERLGSGAAAVAIFNFTPVPRPGLRLGLPLGGDWHELVNTDAQRFGGSGVGNPAPLAAVRDPAMGRAWSTELTLPPLAALLLVPHSQRISPSS